MVECQIFLDFEDRPAFIAGKTVKGKIGMFLDRPVMIRGIFVKVFGGAYCHWVEEEKVREGSEERIILRDIDNQELLVDAKHYLLGSEFGDAIEVPSGAHRYDFECPLPSHLPATFQGAEFGFVRYYIGAAMLVAQGNSIIDCTKVIFEVAREDDLNEFPELKLPCDLEEITRFCCCCCRSEPVIMNVSLPCSGFARGQTVRVTINYINNSDVDIEKTDVALVRTIKSIGNREPIKQKVETDKVIKVQGDGVREKKSKNFELTFTIPQDAACSNENFTEIFKISYELEVDAITAGCHFDINISIPLTIGTIPLTGFGIDDHTRVPNPASHLISTDMNDASPAYSTIPSAPMSDLPPSFEEAMRSLNTENIISGIRNNPSFGWNVTA